MKAKGTQLRSGPGQHLDNLYKHLCAFLEYLFKEVLLEDSRLGESSLMEEARQLMDKCTDLKNTNSPVTNSSLCIAEVQRMKLCLKNLSSCVYLLPVEIKIFASQFWVTSLPRLRVVIEYAGVRYTFPCHMFTSPFGVNSRTSVSMIRPRFTAAPPRVFIEDKVSRFRSHRVAKFSKFDLQLSQRGDAVLITIIFQRNGEVFMHATFAMKWLRTKNSLVRYD